MAASAREAVETLAHVVEVGGVLEPHEAGLGREVLGADQGAHAFSSLSAMSPMLRWCFMELAVATSLGEVIPRVSRTRPAMARGNRGSTFSFAPAGVGEIEVFLLRP